MNHLIRESIEARAALQAAMTRSLEADEAAELAPMPANLRPATEADLSPGALIWHPTDAERGSRAWVQVWKLVRPDDDGAAFVGHDGCRYDLTGAFVEVEHGCAHEG
jgi:hypothetical protein